MKDQKCNICDAELVDVDPRTRYCGPVCKAEKYRQRAEERYAANPEHIKAISKKCREKKAAEDPDYYKKKSADFKEAQKQKQIQVALDNETVLDPIFAHLFPEDIED